jgi:TonB family protein
VLGNNLNSVRAVFTFLFVASAIGQKVYTGHDEGIVPPRVIEKSAPDYTEEARRARLEGTVLLTFVVDEDATLHDVHVTRSLGLGLDEQALEAIHHWQFSPGTKDGQPIRVLTRLEMSFRMLTGRSDWHLNRVEFDTPRGAARPILITAEFPPPISRDATSSAVISFDIDEQGAPANVHVETISADQDDKWDQQIIAALQAWKFQPAFLNGKPIRVRATFGFAAGEGTAPSNVSGAAVRPG